LCKNASDAINELVKWGVRFHREKDGRLTQRFFGAHAYRRTVFYQDWTGKEIIRVLLEQVNQRQIDVLDDIYILKLLKADIENVKREKEETEIIGAFGIDFKNKEFVIFKCRALILASGGYTRVYDISSSRSFENFGEGLVFAYEAGADLVDMEMVQFHPTGMVWPEKALGTLATEAIRGEGGFLLNSKGERYMKNYYPERMELGPRDVVARATYNEIVSGRGTKHGGVWLDVTHLPKEKILERLSTMYKQFKNMNGIDISKDKMEVGPTAHYSMGGIVVDMKCRTKIRGLFAVGEIISQIHGANRLGGNSLLDTIVFGKIAGYEAATFAKENSEKQKGEEKKDIDVIDSDIGDEIFIVKEPIMFLNEIQELMKQNAGIIREETKLKIGLKRILELKKEFYSKDKIIKEFTIDHENIVLTWEVKSSLVICEAIIKCALMRQESRGAHYRSDFPNSDDNKWKVNIYCRTEGKEMILFKQNVKEIRGPLIDLLKNHTKSKHHREFE
ncbi:MAG TPA: FAD-binding protein, partial [Nitrososphaeraceae archaeon]|nr:FAD-binding protein [Nitrososphaeraceae archaeon]